LLPVAMHIVKRNKSTPLYIKEVKVYTAPDSIYKRNYRLEKRQPPVSMKTMFFSQKTLHTKGGCHGCTLR
ncbi:MAG: hypothetical protein OER74_20990, partial [Desulfobacteraceae bacterium]|nr:hypothetical protein [Desulfobacteraceae bacterium]